MVSGRGNNALIPDNGSIACNYGKCKTKRDDYVQTEHLFNSSLNRAVEHARERANIPHWRVHDFRTAFRTHAVRAPEGGGLGIAPNVADAVLGHKEASLGFDRYTGEPERYLLAEKRDVLLKWARSCGALSTKPV